MTEPTPKPTDALESLRKQAAWWDKHDTCSVPGDCFQHRMVAELDAAIAAWEKERAEARQMYDDASHEGDVLLAELQALCAALKRIEGEMERVEKDSNEAGQTIFAEYFYRYREMIRAAREGGK